MIYLDNTQNTQEVWIPRNDGDGNIYIPHTYQEGYEDGIEHQKSLLSSATFTENGEYERSDGWSAVTVEVEPALEEVNVVISTDTTTIAPSSGYYGISEATIDASGYAQENYDSGFDDGYTDGYSSGSTDGYDSGYTEGYDSGYTSGTTDGYGSGYTSGHTDGIDEQKALLTTTALTENGSYQRENGWSGVTVNVDTASTYNSGYTSGYTDGYDSGYTSGNTDGYDSGYTEGYDSGSTDGFNSGYTDGYQSGSTDGFNSGYTSGETHQKSLLGTTAFTINGSYSAENGYSAITVNVDTASTYQSGYTSGHTDGVSEEKAKLSAATFTANTAITISDGGYSAITIDVPQSGSTEKDIVICTSGGCWFNMDYQIEYGDVFEIEHCTFGKAGVVSYSHQQYLGGNSGEFFRIGQSNVDLYLKYFNNSIQLYTSFPQSGSIFEDNTIVYSSTAFTVDGNVVSSYTTNYTSTKGTLVVFANTTSGGDRVGNQTAKIGRLKVYASDGTLKATFEPRLDEFNVPYFKYIEQDIDIYASGNTAPFYEEIIVDSSYQSGFTDGYNSGYTEGYNSGTTDGYSDGENAVISTFTAMTATTNGVYGSSANPLSSITVNVPQSGGGGTVVITPVDYIHKTTLSNNANDSYIDTLITPTTATTFRVVGMGKGYGQGNTIVGYQDNDSADYRLFWHSTNGRNLCFDFNNERLENSNWGGATNGKLIDITCNNYSVTSGDSQTPMMTGITQSSIQDPHTIKIDVGTWWCKSLQIWDGQTLVFDGQAAYDDSGNIGLFDSVSKSLVYNSGLSMSYEIEGVSFSAITITANTAITVSDGGYSAITVDVPQSSGVYGTKTITLNGTYSASTDSLDGYSAVTVNVSQSGIVTPLYYADYVHSQTPLANTTQYLIDTGVYPTTGTTMRLKALGKGLEQNSVIVGYADNDSADYRVFWYGSGGRNLCFDFNNERLEESRWGRAYDGRVIDFTISNYKLYDNVLETYLVSGTTQSSIQELNTIKVDAGSIWLKSLEIYDDNNNLVFNGQAAYDANGNVGIYDSVSSKLLKPSGTTLVYEPLVPAVFNGKSLYIDHNQNNQIAVYTDTTDKYYIGNGYTTIIRFHKNNDGDTQSGVTWFSVKDLGENGYQYNGFSIGAMLYVIDAKDEDGTTQQGHYDSRNNYTQSPTQYDWETCEIKLKYESDTCQYSIVYDDSILITSAFTVPNQVENAYGLIVGIGNGRGIIGLECVKTYDNTTGDLIGYVVYNPSTNTLMDLLDDTITFNVSGGTTADLDGQYL